MSFLDSLENSLKSLESREERDGSEALRREQANQQAQAIAPWAERLKNSDYTHQLLDLASQAGHRVRAKLYMAWIENTLRLELKGKVCELYPTADGVYAHYRRFSDDQELTEPISLETNAAELLAKWLDK